MRFLSGCFRRHFARPYLLHYIIDGMSNSPVIVLSNMAVVDNPSAADDNDSAAQARMWVAEELSEIFEGVTLHIRLACCHMSFASVSFLLSSCIWVKVTWCMTRDIGGKKKFHLLLVQD
jgi:hypothetical protein